MHDSLQAKHKKVEIGAITLHQFLLFYNIQPTINRNYLTLFHASDLANS